jgi:hypothetical protein
VDMQSLIKYAHIRTDKKCKSGNGCMYKENSTTRSPNQGSNGTKEESTVVDHVRQVAVNHEITSRLKATWLHLENCDVIDSCPRE